MYSIEFTNNASRQFLRLEKPVRERLRPRIKSLADWPPTGLDVKRLKGQRVGEYRLRVGDYRVIFVVNEEARSISVREIGPRGRFY